MQKLLDRNGIRKIDYISVRQFQELFVKESDHILFKWFADIKSQSGLQNLYKPSQQKSDQQKQPAQSQQQETKHIKKAGLTTAERKRLEQFFTNQVVNKNDVKQSMKVLENLFRNIKMHEILR